jgi:hypothetical protein
MARIDKTDSAIGVFRGVLAAAWTDPTDIGVVTAVGINSSGLVVKGAGQTGIVGLVIPTNKWDLQIGSVVDVMTNGELVECAGLAAGTQYYANATTGVVSSTNTGTPIGWTVESDRLIVRTVGRQVALTST